MYRTYRVELEDTLESIANKFDTTVDILKQINGFDISTMIIPGNYIIVPNNERGIFEVYKIKKGDNLYSLVQKNNVDLKVLTELNGLDEDEYLYIDQEILIPKENVGIYITEQGDTISDIVKKTGKTISELFENNENIYLQPEQLLVYKKEKNV